MLRKIESAAEGQIEISSRVAIGFGAGRETRTLTVFPPPDFESGASANFAIPARENFGVA